MNFVENFVIVCYDVVSPGWQQWGNLTEQGLAAVLYFSSMPDVHLYCWLRSTYAVIYIFVS